MLRNRGMLTFLSLILVGVLLVGCGGAPAGGGGGQTGSGGGEKIVIKVSHAAPTSDARHAGAEKMKEVIESETNGQVEVQIYPASQLGNPTETVEAMQNGTIEMVILPSAFLGGFQPLVSVLDLPFFLPEDVNDLLEVHRSDAVRQVLDTTDEVGIHTLGIWHTGYKQFSANKPLRSPADFRGVKFRAMPSPVLIGEFEVVGANPINLPFSETYSALQTGAIDGQENPVNTIHDMKFHEVQKYLTMSYHGTLDQLIMINKKFYDGLPENVKAAVQAGFEAGAEATFQATQEAERSDLEAIKASGTEIVELSADERAKLQEAFAQTKDIYLELTGDRGKQLLEAMEEAIQAAESN